MSFSAKEKKTPARDRASLLLNALIVVLAIVVCYLSYAFIHRTLIEPRTEPERAEGELAGVIQIDVLNGCGDSGMASKCSSFLRSRGFDVVEMRNYKTFDVEESLIVDRAGNRENALRVARALGVKEQNVIQQINQDYYVDVSVVIGKDYHRLRPFD